MTQPLDTPSHYVLSVERARRDRQAEQLRVPELSPLISGVEVKIARVRIGGREAAGQKFWK
jgi:hypothetical protein